MQTRRIVARLLEGCVPFMHLARWRALCDVSQAAVDGHWLSLSRLACGTARATTLRHRVKCVDRLLGSGHLAEDRVCVYAAIARRWLSGLPQLLIVVDWSSLSADLQWHWLRASVVVEGRSLTLYEEVHPRRHLANRNVHRHFLERLAQILPDSDQAPIVMTDAGFRGTWFRMLARRGWHWVGRIRNRDFVRNADRSWFPAKNLYALARPEAQDLGGYQVPRSHPLTSRLVLIAPPRQGRKSRYPSGRERGNTPMKKIAARQREPWLLSCSPSLAHLSAEAVVQLYAQRMRIEEQFRDTKSGALGLGLRESRSSGVKRLQALLLIAHVATLTKRLIGEAAQAHNLQLQLMSTNRRDRSEISILTLASRVIAQPRLLRNLRNVWEQWGRLRQQAIDAVKLAVRSG